MFVGFFFDAKINPTKFNVTEYIFQTHAAKGTLDFDEDPFKNANHRYGDPFELTGADPDPFARYDDMMDEALSLGNG